MTKPVPNACPIDVSSAIVLMHTPVSCDRVPTLIARVVASCQAVLRQHRREASKRKPIEAPLWESK